MKKKLTLRLDEQLIKKAKQYAAEKGTSVSQVVADFFQGIQAKQVSETEVDYKLPPSTASLAGILEGKDVDEQTYREHLEKKHLS
ncbi:MAG: DUF6364 family protein [Bacteroidota bacterium]